MNPYVFCSVCQHVASHDFATDPSMETVFPSMETVFVDYKSWRERIRSSSRRVVVTKHGGDPILILSPWRHEYQAPVPKSTFRQSNQTDVHSSNSVFKKPKNKVQVLLTSRVSTLCVTDYELAIRERSLGRSEQTISEGLSWICTRSQEELFTSCLRWDYVYYLASCSRSSTC